MQTGRRKPVAKPVALPGGRLDPAQCIFRQMTRTSRAVAALYDEAFRASGLSAHQFNLLMTMERTGPASVGTLAAVVGADGSTLPRAVAPLVQRGWVAVTPGDDRRQRIISITAKGRTKLRRAIPAWSRAQSGMLDELGDGAWLRLMGDLKAVRTGVERVRTMLGRRRPRANRA